MSTSLTRLDPPTVHLLHSLPPFTSLIQNAHLSGPAAWLVAEVSDRLLR